MAAVDADIDRRARVADRDGQGRMLHLAALVLLWYLTLTAIVWWVAAGQ